MPPFVLPECVHGRGLRFVSGPCSHRDRARRLSVARVPNANLRCGSSEDPTAVKVIRSWLPRKRWQLQQVLLLLLLLLRLQYLVCLAGDFPCDVTTRLPSRTLTLCQICPRVNLRPPTRRLPGQPTIDRYLTGKFRLRSKTRLLPLRQPKNRWCQSERSRLRSKPRLPLSHQPQVQAARA